ncbi:MAG: alcohol dehydrogenase [Bryobacterales bacterium]|nr:alcohol dehydrogenase [Bryobacterales bacterium]
MACDWRIGHPKSCICYTDVHQTLGHFPGPFPRILGHEPVSEIVAVAPDDTTRKGAANGASVAWSGYSVMGSVVPWFWSDFTQSETTFAARCDIG